MDAPKPPSLSFDVLDALKGQNILITGGTGFLGRVLVEKLLWSAQDVGKLFLLIRPDGERSARDRLARELLDADIMGRLLALHGDAWKAWVAEKLEVVSGDLAQDRFGLDEGSYEALCQRVDCVVACAATVTFDERLDRALQINVLGARRTLDLARAAGNAPLLHVSTCFVSGRRAGAIEERVVDAEALDADLAMAALEEARATLRDSGVSGDGDWVAAGASQAQRFGFNDIYTLTKALAERQLARDRREVPVAIVRPAIVESAAREPIPGWIEAVRVADPLLVAYGRGRTHELPGSADVPLEVIPVDYVANASIVALASLVASAESPEIPVYQLGSQRNPITLGRLMELGREGFARTPLRDEAGEPIVVGPARFVPPPQYLDRLVARRRRLRTLARWIPRRRTSRARLELGSAVRTHDHLIHLLSVYAPYLSHGASFEDLRTQELWSRLSSKDQERFPFDIAALDWTSYIVAKHVPGLIRFALRSESGAPPAESAEGREPQADILARAVRHAADARSIFELFASTAESYPDVIAFQTCRDGRWLRYTYAQALTTTANVSARLAAQYDIGPGDRVVLWASGRPEWVLTTLAVHRLGGVTVPLDPQWPAAEVAQAAQLVDAKLICAAPALVSSLEPTAAGDSPRLDDAPACPVVPLAAPWVPEPEVGLLPGVQTTVRPGEEGDLASIIFTSGTTVAPKAVPLTHANFLANVRDLLPLMKLTRERLLSVLPIHHVFEQMVGWLVPMAGGSSFSYVAELKPAEISWMMNTTRPTVLVAVPRLLELLHNGIRQSVANGGPMLKLIFRVLFALSRRRNGENGHRLFSKVHQRFGGSLRRIASGGSALEPSLGRSFQLMGFRVAEGYGMTETSPVLTVNPWDAIRFGTVGRRLPGVEIDLRTPAEAAEGLAPGAGEVWVRGANVMSGYYQNADATAAVMEDGWLNTGDIGFFDPDGYLVLSGRTKDVIVTSAGKNVYPEEVEARYREIPGVQELIAIGLPSPSGGERVTAIVVPSAGADEAEIRASIAARSKEVPSYQEIAAVELWHGELPKTTTMKVKRTVLRNAVVAGERGTPAETAATSQPTTGESAEALTVEQAAVVAAVARLTSSRPDLIQAGDRLADLGLDSLARVELVGELEARFGLHLEDETVASLDQVRDLFALIP